MNDYVFNFVMVMYGLLMASGIVYILLHSGC